MSLIKVQYIIYNKFITGLLITQFLPVGKWADAGNGLPGPVCVSKFSLSPKKMNENMIMERTCTKLM